LAQVEADDKTVPYESLKINDKVTVKFNKGKYFNEPLTAEEKSVYVKSSLSQIDPLLAQVEPMNEKGEGVVQLTEVLDRSDHDGLEATWREP